MPDLHVIPIDDAIEHVEALICWCRPIIDFELGDERIVAHHSADGREAHEPDAVYPPAVRH